jgi:hypothetical protein
MPYTIVNEFEGGTREQYDAAVKVVHPPDGLPLGQTHHYAGPSPTGWVVVAVWDSKVSWDAFRDQTLLPGLEGLSDSGFPGPPRTTEFDVDVDLSR